MTTRTSVGRQHRVRKRDIKAVLYNSIETGVDLGVFSSYGKGISLCITRCACFRIEGSVFELWPETLCCVLGQETRSASLHPDVKMVPANLKLVLSLRWTSIPSRAE